LVAATHHLEPRAREQDTVRVARGLAACGVGDRNHRSAELARQAHCREGVGGLARLGDPEHERADADDRIAVAELRRDLDVDGDARPPFDRSSPGQAGVIGAPARDDDDSLQAAQTGF
jgi:hypothetical protein